MSFAAFGGGIDTGVDDVDTALEQRGGELVRQQDAVRRQRDREVSRLGVADHLDGRRMNQRLAVGGDPQHRRTRPVPHLVDDRPQRVLGEEERRLLFRMLFTLPGHARKQAVLTPQVADLGEIQDDGFRNVEGAQLVRSRSHECQRRIRRGYRQAVQRSGCRRRSGHQHSPDRKHRDDATAFD